MCVQTGGVSGIESAVGVQAFVCIMKLGITYILELNQIRIFEASHSCRLLNSLKKEKYPPVFFVSLIALIFRKCLYVIL